MSSEFHIRGMEESDIEAADQLRASAGWNQLPSDWRRAWRYQPRGCFVAEQGGGLVGTVTTTSYGTALAWIGMMLVHPDHRRQGIATALMTEAIDYLQRTGVTCIRLDATPAGEPVYERLGFQAEWQFHRWARGGSDSSSELPINNSPPLTVYAQDAEAFGVDRTRWLQQLAAESLVVTTDDGFGMIRNGSLADYLGPVSTSSSTTAEKIIGQLLQHTQRTVFWDIPAPNDQAILIATALGFRPVRELTRMWMGAAPLRANLPMQFALSDPGMG